MMTPECNKRYRRRPAAIALIAWLTVPCTAVAASLPGRIWSPSADTFVGEPVLLSAVARADFLVLGETHTLASHHELQARLLGVAADRGSPRPVLFEMIGQDQQDEIDSWRSGGASPAEFGAAVRWEERGWPAWSIYQPIVEAAVDRGLDLYGAAPARETLQAVARKGLEALEPAVRAELHLHDALPQQARKRLEDTLIAAHCGIGEHAPLDRMLAMQRLRDAAMAARMRAVATPAGAMLITGNGHARQDHGVPHYLGRMAPDQNVVSIALMGAGGGRSLDEHRALAGGSLPFDYVWFTEEEPPIVTCPEGGKHDGGGAE